MNKHFENKLVQIYVIKNDGGFIKIGVTTNTEQRLQSLSASNGGGHKIVEVWTSPETYLYTMERVLHMHYHNNRIKGSEWFKDLDFNEVVTYAKSLFASDSYRRCNQIREEIYNERRKELC